MGTATAPPTPRRSQEDDRTEERQPKGSTTEALGDGPVDSWTDNDEYLGVEN